MPSTAVSALSFSFVVSFCSTFDHDFLNFFDGAIQRFHSMFIPKDLMRIIFPIL
jgi:hypothetical protein